MNNNKVVEFNKKNVTLERSEKGYGRTHFAARNFNPGDKIMLCRGEIITQQNSHISIQIGHGFHFMPGEWTGAHLNHSCEPNAYMNTGADGFPVLYALHKIKKGAEINYHYSMTEHAWARYCKESYTQCLCGSKSCKGKILSFSQLSLKEQKDLISKKLCCSYLYKSMNEVYMKALVSTYSQTLLKKTTINKVLSNHNSLIMPGKSSAAARMYSSQTIMEVII